VNRLASQPTFCSDGGRNTSKSNVYNSFAIKTICYRSMAHLWVADGEGLQVCRVATCMLNKHNTQQRVVLNIGICVRANNSSL